MRFDQLAAAIRGHDVLVCAFIKKLGQSFTIGEAGRAQLELFLHDRTVRWSFLSPPFFMRLGPRTGTYRTTVEFMPMENGTPAGISVADLAVAIADECEREQFVWKHWSAARLPAEVVGSSDSPMPGTP